MTQTLIGQSKAVKNIIKQIKTLSAKKNDILIIGEQGSGKSIVAKNIHAASRNGKEPSQPIIVTPTEISEKELSAILARSADASGGSVIIDEIERTSFRKQGIVYQFIDQLQNRQERSNDTPHVRIIVTTKSDPVKLANKKQLTNELAQILSKFTRLFVPPLRDRREDIPQLVEHFVNEACRKIGITEPVIDINALSILVEQPWKHNIRELKTVIDRSVIFSTNGMFSLPPEMVDESVKVTRLLGTLFTVDGEKIDESLDTIERGLLYSTLKRFNYNFSKAADFLGMNKQRLQDRVNQLRPIRASK
jgi:DNA-binding NtrC family response regulator